MKLHSEVDVITNSSSVVYVWPTGNAIASTKAFLAKILSVAGLEESVDDLFDVKYTVSGDYIDRMMDSGEDSFVPILNDYLASIGMTEEEFEALGWQDGEPHFAQLAETIADLYAKGQWNMGEDGNGWPLDRYVRVAIQPKAGIYKDDEFNLWGQICQIFDYDATYG